jgi:Zn-dependent M16 (insulinase) family peptidase
VSSSYLHPEIREKGGAYGSGAMSGEGLWSFYSFRDPNTTKYAINTHTTHHAQHTRTTRTRHHQCNDR